MSIRYKTRYRASTVSLIAALTLSGGFLTACGSGGGHEATAVAAHGHAHPAAHPTAQVSAEVALYTTMRTLWDEHMEWTWSTVVAFAADSPALQPTIDRLLRNQADIGNAVAPYYGEDAAKRLTELLTTHIEEAVPVLTAAKAGDKVALNKATRAWYANARDIADFLAHANPNWSRHDMRLMMRTHITQTLAYAGSVLGGDFKAAIATFDEAQTHMGGMADMLSQGLIEQFPDKF